MNKTLITAIAAASTLSWGVAVAQQPPNQQQHGPPGAAHGGAPHGGGPGGGPGGHGPGGPGGGSHAQGQQHGAPGAFHGSQQAVRPGGPGFASRGGPGGHAFFYGGRSHQAIAGPAFRYPPGWSYRRWGIGQFLPSLFLGSSYFFDAYADYGFGPPPYGYRWVRYGPDLLLVNLRNGRISNVVYGAFY